MNVLRDNIMNDTDRIKYETAIGSGWKIGRLIGQGAYGSVYEIERANLGVTFRSALKIISIPRNDSELREIMAEGHDKSSARTYFQSVAKEMTSELSLMSKLKGHTNIVSYEDHIIIDHDDGIGLDILIRMELLTPLLSYLERRSISRELILKLGIDMCNALIICEKNNIIHRDIKPANIFISDTGDFKLGDFGVARIAERSTGASTRAGSPDYMAPEVKRGKGKYGNNVDIFSLGVVLYQLSNHMRLPFYPRYPEPVYASDKEEAVTKRLKEEKFPAPDDVGKQMWKVIQRACEYNPNKRYTFANEMLVDLRKVSDNKNIRSNYSYELKIILFCLMSVFVISIVLGLIIKTVRKQKLQEEVSQMSTKEGIYDTSNEKGAYVEEIDNRESNSKIISAEDNNTEKTISVKSVSENKMDESLDYNILYYPIIDAYIEIFTDDFAMPDETKVPYSFKETIRTENIKMEEMEYIYYDLDNNGIDELLVMLRNDDLNSKQIYAIYTLENNHVVPIEFSFLTMARDGTYLFKDGIVGKMNGGTGFDSRSYCRLDADSYEWQVLETVAMVSSNYGNDTHYYLSTSQESIQEAPDDKPEIYTEINEEKMDSIISKYEIEANIETVKFSEYSATTTVSNNSITFNNEQIEMIGKALNIPDYKLSIARIDQGDAYLWEGMGLRMAPIAFYIDDVCIAQADVNVDDCTLMRAVSEYDVKKNMQE